MLTRTHKILMALLAVQLSLAAVTLLRTDAGAAPAETPLLDRFDAAKVTRLRIEAGQGKPVLDLARRGEGWVLASHHEHPAVSAKVTDVLAPLAKMAASAPIATQRSRHAQLRVGDAAHDRKLTVTVDGEDLTVFVGGPAGGHRTAVRLAADDRVFAVGGVSAHAIGVEPRDWIETAYLRVKPDEIVKVTVARGASRLELARAKAGDPWTASLDGEPVSPGANEVIHAGHVEDLVTTASSIDIRGPADPARDARTPYATVTIERASASASIAPVVVDVLEDADAWWVRERGRAHAGRVDKVRLEPLFEVTRDKLVTAKPSDG